MHTKEKLESMTRLLAVLPDLDKIFHWVICLHIQVGVINWIWIMEFTTHMTCTYIHIYEGVYMAKHVHMKFNISCHSFSSKLLSQFEFYAVSFYANAYCPDMWPYANRSWKIRCLSLKKLHTSSLRMQNWEVWKVKKQQCSRVLICAPYFCLLLYHDYFMWEPCPLNLVSVEKSNNKRPAVTIQPFKVQAYKL